jgi:hypothetical protein
MSLPVKKIYVDSKWKTSDSASHSDFKFELDTSLNLPNNTVFYIDDICIPHSWYNVDETSNQLYVYSEGNGPCIIYSIPANNYNGITLKDALNTVFSLITPNMQLQALYNVGTNKLTIQTNSSSTTFKILTNEDLKKPNNGWSGASYDKNKPNSINNLIGNTGSTSDTFTQGSSYISGFLNFNGLRNIYICSSNLCAMNIVGPRGAVHNIIKKVPVTSDYGFNIFSGGSIAHDYVEASKQVWKCLEFRIEDTYGNIINLNNSPVSFSIVLSTILEDL